MRILIIVFALLFTFSCANYSKFEQARFEETTLTVVAKKVDWTLYKVKIDSTEYLILDGIKAVSIVKHK